MTYDARKDGLDSYTAAIAAKRAELLMSKSPAARRVEVIGDCTLYLGDCLEIMPSLGKVDAVVTDPPWGLGKLRGTIARQRNKNNYTHYEDTEENVENIVIPSIKWALIKANGRGVISCGIPCMWLYPRPRAVGGFYQPAAVGMSPWGFAGYNPVLFFGKDPRDGKGQSNVMVKLTERASNDIHPCAKPFGAMKWMVLKGSLDGDLIIDPFMGSGTTGVACVKTGRKFIGIEIDEDYFNIACDRIREAYAQPDLFIAPPAKPKQEELL